MSLRGAAGRVALSVCCEGHIETKATWQSHVHKLLEIASLGFDTAEEHRLLNQRSQ
jgi:hypothetical protein